MIFYTGIGYLVGIIFIAPLVIFGSILNWGLGIDPLSTTSWWPLSLAYISRSSVYLPDWLVRQPEQG
jgi:hypothetical protein